MKPSQKPSNPIRRAGRATGTPRTVRDMGLVAVLAIGMSACSTTLKVQTEVKPDTDFTRYHTFALLPLPAAVPATDPGLALRVTEPARQAVIQSLMTKGFKEAERAQADIVVSLRGESLPKVEVTDWGYTRMGYTRYGRVPIQVGEREVRTYEQRTLAVEIFDNQTKQLAWVGWTKRDARGAIDVERVQEAIRNILAEFPPSARSIQP